MPKLPLHPRHAEAYGGLISRRLHETGRYDETQCRACPHGHRCCDLVVSCTPVEAVGIVDWVERHHPDPAATFRRVAGHADALSTFAQGYRSRADAVQQGDPAQQLEAMLDGWFRLGKKCPFYDAEQRGCGIYPVRPVNCRKAWGQGDCSAGGIRTEEEDPAQAMARGLRVQEAALMRSGEIGQELTWLVTHLRGPDAMLSVSSGNQALLRADPAHLDENFMLHGPNGPLIDNPFGKDSAHGSP
jgi:Fe-S-cluster containining protein